MTTAIDKLQTLGSTDEIVSFVTELMEKTGAAELAGNRSRHSVPLVPEQGAQVAIYPMRSRVAIALDPEQAESFGRRLGVPVERKNPRTHYVHVRAAQLHDETLRRVALEAAVASLEVCRDRASSAAGQRQRPVEEPPAACPQCSLVLAANGACGCD